MDSVDVISQIVTSHFPGSIINENKQGGWSRILTFGSRDLIEFNNSGVTYHIQNRYPKNRWSWSGVIEGSLDTLAEMILQDLADAGYQTLSSKGKKMRKRPIRLDKYTECINCRAKGTIKRYFFGKIGKSSFALKLARDRIILGRERRPTDPEAICTSCSWTGSTEVYRFKRKKT